MASSAIAIFEKSTIESYIHDLKIAEMICYSKRILILYLMLISVIFKRKKMMNHLKTLFSFPGENNRDHLTKEVCEIQDGFVKLQELSDQTRFMRPFRRLLEKAAIEWDDFAEECTVGSDTETKDLLHQINNAI